MLCDYSFLWHTFLCVELHTHLHDRSSICQVGIFSYVCLHVHFWQFIVVFDFSRKYGGILAVNSSAIALSDIRAAWCPCRS